MPNHITNVLTIEDLGTSNLNQVTKLFLNDKRCVDFEVIRPSPECLKDFEPHCGVLDRAKMALGLLELPESRKDYINSLGFHNAMTSASNQIQEDDIPKVIRAISNWQTCGYMYWFDWQSEHWGTKWNAYDQSDDGHPKGAKSFSFQTAWEKEAAA